MPIAAKSRTNKAWIAFPQLSLVLYLILSVSAIDHNVVGIRSKASQIKMQRRYTLIPREESILTFDLI